MVQGTFGAVPCSYEADLVNNVTKHSSAGAFPSSPAKPTASQLPVYEGFFQSATKTNKLM